MRFYNNLVASMRSESFFNPRELLGRLLIRLLNHTGDQQVAFVRRSESSRKQDIHDRIDGPSS